MSSEVEDLDPYGNYYFALEIEGTEVAYFTECSGLKSVTTIYEIEEGGLNGRTHKLPGQSKWENILLKYATSASTYLVEWRDAVLQATDKVEAGADKVLRSGSIKVMNNHGDVVKRYDFTKGWPVSWEGPSLNSGGSDIAIEVLEIAHEGLVIYNEGGAPTNGGS